VLLARPWVLPQLQPMVEAGSAVTSVLVFGDVTEYLHNRRDFESRYQRLWQLTEHIYPYSVSIQVAARYAALRRQLRPPRGQGLIGDVDILIAATALENDLTVVTMDSDFLRAPNLRVTLIARQQPA
jgi:predicted nucleic acid-binding protein